MKFINIILAGAHSSPPSLPLLDQVVGVEGNPEQEDRKLLLHRKAVDRARFLEHKRISRLIQPPVRAPAKPPSSSALRTLQRVWGDYQQLIVLAVVMLLILVLVLVAYLPGSN